MAGQYNEPYEKLSKKTREVHRAYVSLIEEIEAMDWWCCTHIPIQLKTYLFRDGKEITTIEATDSQGHFVIHEPEMKKTITKTEFYIQ